MCKVATFITVAWARKPSFALASVVALIVLLTCLPNSPAKARELPMGDASDGHVVTTTTTNNNKLESMGQKGAPTGTRSKIINAIFDFSAYKQLFHKSYKSLIEELNRRRYFLARAFRALISSIKYNHRQMTYYLGVNHMSDMSPHELTLMDNKALERETLNNLLVGHGGEVEFNTIQLDDESSSKKEQLPELESVVDKVEDKIEEFLENRPEIESEILQAVGVDFVDKSKDVKITRRKRDVTLSNNQSSQTAEANNHQVATSLVSGPYAGMSFLVQKDKSNNLHNQTEEVDDDDDDQVFVDHRESGCLFDPRGQGKCGSCYSFSIVAYMEWLHCKRTKKLLAFSEQYLIDCGRGRLGNLSGCSGGGRFSVGDFVLNFGLELRTNYPYRMREDQCPYSNNTLLEQAGKYRWTGLGTGSSIPMQFWSTFLKFSPMIISMSTSNSKFKEYGGGIYDGSACEPNKSNHMMLLVGHGREDKEEYWLIRNSYTVGWGEGGYMKLAKKANCIHPAKGFMYGTADGGRTFTAEPVKNKQNDQTPIKAHYARNMALDLKKWMV